ncbi:hypothetical protein JCM31826_05340 [Thermaurantimonas aggregans]|uniref:LTD domain-containing protein n=1 Tax=Thermaurantimonas aggregans TaxID=2173829 RepID=A0A401XJ54_9FLAO|nr:hypothetical protein [Thermaurantimonas aggregans]MCX8149654.1 hypothetical protein [Thermaurantimonas aggregans]GCD77052.1 hypothetical protein JCM31826_05340 [Thermaurantimonas aggregans]
MKIATASLIALIALSSCLKDRKLPIDQGTNPPPPPVRDTVSLLQSNTLRINELVASSSNLSDEFGQNSDWVEIFNPSNTSWVKVTAGKTFLSDSKGNPTKYAFTRDWYIPPRGFLIVFCNSRSSEGQFINTSFGLSSAGEDFVISFQESPSSPLVRVDEMSYAPYDFTKSIGLRPDGTGTTYYEMVMTPNAPNQ